MNLLRSALVTLALAGTAGAQQLFFHEIATGFNGPIGIDHHAPTNTVVVSVNYGSGSPVALERILPNGNHVGFSALNGVLDEVKIATIRGGAVNQGGFPIGDLYVGNGADGEIVRVSANGLTIVDPWISLPGSGNGLIRGSLYHDRTGVFGGDLIVCTTLGQVWRITSGATTSASPLAAIGTHLEGLCTIPNDSAKYGPLAGKIVCGAEQQGLLYAIDAAGTVTSYDFDVDIEDIDLIPWGQNFYGVNFGVRKILGVDASEFASVAGDILLTQEIHTGSGLHRLHWNAATPAFEVTEFGIETGSATIGQWEHVTFSHGGINPLPAMYAGVNKDLINATGSTADEVVITVVGTYDASDVRSHYDGGFPNFAISYSGGNTHFAWSGMNVPNLGLVHVGVELYGPSITFTAVTWKASGVQIGCARQVNSLYGTHTSGNGQIEYANTVSACSAQTLYVGDISVEYYIDPPPLAELNPAGTRSPIHVDMISGAPVGITNGASQIVVVPTAPSGARHVLLVFKVGTSSSLALPDVTHDFVLLPIDTPNTPSVFQPVVYCTSGTTTNGCNATIGATANPDVGHTNSCVVTVSNIEGAQTGILFYGVASGSPSPWCSGGASFLCVKAPLWRTGVANAGGTFGACDGSLSLDWNVYQLGHAGALGQPWTAGVHAYVQGWFRDPPACKTTNLSNAVDLTYQP